MRKLILASMTIFAFLPGFAKAATCEDADVKTVRSRLFPADPQSAELAIKYRFVDRSQDPDLPVIIFIPGGPGSPSINGSLSRVPKEFSLVLTDIRGAGCNAHESARLPDSAINTESAVADLVEIVKDLGNRRYVVYGNSYGTVLSTRLVFTLEKKGIRPPERVVLSGVMAKTFTTPEEVEIPYINAFEQYKDKLGAKVVDVLSSEKPLGIEGHVWADLIQNLLVQGSILNGPTPVSLLVSQLKLLETEQGQEQLKAGLSQIAQQKTPEDVVRVRSLIGCREMFPPSTLRLHAFTLQGGRLVPTTEPSICRNTSIEEAYDVAQFRIKTPILYVQGLSDPATPIAQAQYHFAAQTKADRLLIALHDGGHNPLNTGMTDDCKLAFWTGAAKSIEDAKEAFNKCSVKFEARRAKAELYQ